ncbi:MAG: class I SAM-dependent methyltransferase [Thermoproteota archaeon]
MNSYVMAAFREPLSAFTYVLKGKDSLIKKKIGDALSVPASEINKYYQEISKLDFIEPGSKIENIGQIASPEILYVICRILKPNIVVETGVASGLSSAYILKALSMNSKGKLISIDMPNYEEELVKVSSDYLDTPQAIIPKDKETGWVVPKNLRNRWTLKIGLVRETLIPALEEAGEIDIFLHDSEHSYENMMFEFENAWSHLKNGGVLLSHDITWNTSFMDFARKVNRRYTTLFFSGMGAIVK